MKFKSKKLIIANSKISSFIIAISPIISPYSIGKLSLFTIVGLIYIFFYFFFLNKHGCIKISKKEISYFSFSNFVLLLALLNMLFLQNNTNLIHGIISLSINSIIIYFLWLNSDFTKVVSYGIKIGYICGIFAIYQIIILLTGGNVPNGRLPFLDLVSGHRWVTETWGFRINSLFSEPSYFAIYLIPLFVCSIKKLDLKNIIIFGFLIIISSSSLGIILMILIIVIKIVMAKDNIIDKFKIIFIVIIMLLLGFAIIKNNNNIQIMLHRSFYKISEINKNDIRLTGYINYLEEYGPRELIIGVGLGQFQNYFMEKGIYLYNYSNSLVMIILQFGIAGSIFAICYYYYLAKISIKNQSLEFFIILMLTMLGDYIIFDIKYFYLMYFVLYYVGIERNNLRKEKKE